MPARPRDLPSLSALKAFEAAARHGGFKAAAHELNVTPAAISHQVKALEGDLRCALFTRQNRGVALTETGADASDQLRRRATRASVTIRVTTAVSALWLTPKLAQFWKAHGTVSVAQIVSDTDAATADCDLSIHYGHMDRDRGTCSLLFHDRIMALGSPAFARAQAVARPAELASRPLIHFDTAMIGWTDWPGWFRALGHDGPVTSAHRVNNYIIALQAARDDMGAVLGWVGLVRSYIDSGQLVPLLPDEMETTEDFYVKLHTHAAPRARLVYDWLVGAA